MSKETPATTGTLRVVNHEFPLRCQSLNLEVPLPSGKSVTLQLTSAEAKPFLSHPEKTEHAFKWNGKTRSLRPVPAEDMIPLLEPVLSL